jgi:hypothetical protein
MRSRLAALLLAVVAGATAARAEEPPAPPGTPFEVVHRAPRPTGSHRLALYTALAGAALVAASFPLSEEADRRYERYLLEVDPDRMDALFKGAQRFDRYSAATLLAGEALLATAVWLRFVRDPQRQRVTLDIRPDRCAVALRF